MVRYRCNFVAGGTYFFTVKRHLEIQSFPRFIRTGESSRRRRAGQAPSQWRVSTVIDDDPSPLSWPGLSRPSTPLILQEKQDVDARDKRGHDESTLMALGRIRTLATALLKAHD